jgi:hypothetical protein
VYPLSIPELEAITSLFFQNIFFQDIEVTTGFGAVASPKPILEAEGMGL